MLRMGKPFGGGTGNGTPEDRRRRVERIDVVVKTVVAAVIAWWLARLLPGAGTPYFAPMGALVTVYPTAQRSVREGLRYAGSFLIGAAIATPAGILLGASALSIAITLLATLTVGYWRRLGDQGFQVAVTALFVLLFGGEHAWEYTLPRLADLGVGITVGLLVNVVVLPPLYLEPAKRSLAGLGAAVEDALGELAEIVGDPGRGWARWRELSGELERGERDARSAFDRADESVRWNLRVLSPQRPQPPSVADMAALEGAAALTREIGTLLREAVDDRERGGFDPEFTHRLAATLTAAGEAARRFGESCQGGERDGFDGAWAEHDRLDRHLADRRAPAPASDMRHRIAWRVHSLLSELSP